MADKYIYPPKDIPKCVCLCGRLVGLDEGATRPVARAANHPHSIHRAGNQLFSPYSRMKREMSEIVRIELQSTPRQRGHLKVLFRNPPARGTLPAVKRGLNRGKLKTTSGKYLRASTNQPSVNQYDIFRRDPPHLRQSSKRGIEETPIEGVQSKDERNRLHSK